MVCSSKQRNQLTHQQQHRSATTGSKRKLCVMQGTMLPSDRSGLSAASAKQQLCTVAGHAGCEAARVSAVQACTQMRRLNVCSWCCTSFTPDLACASITALLSCWACSCTPCISSITAAAYPFYSSQSCHLMIHSPQHPNLVCTGCLWHVLQPDRAVPLPLQLCVRPLLQLP